ncbi:MAG: toll/interleukin-1 receptor domain-containing protein [Eubacteriales bacterium]
MKKIDMADRDILNNIYKKFESESEITVSSPDYKKTLIDYFVNQGLLTKIDASTLSGWAYIIGPTHDGELTIKETANPNFSKVEAFIEQGNVIMKEEYHVTEPGLAFPDYISGPKSDQWFNEISIFNSRTLINHPLHDQIAEVCKNHKRSLSAHEDMMGYLKALASDNDFWDEANSRENTMTIYSRKTIDQLLAEDIMRCEEFLRHPNDKAGQQLYVEITSRYDSVIDNFGNGLYQYFSEQHFYDPEVSGESLIHNIRTLQGKMISYQATHYPEAKVSFNGEKALLKYDVFISHANVDKIEYVEQLKQSLDKLKINIFYDKDTLEWGDKWKDKILEGVGQAEFAIIVISDNFFGREWTEKELNEFLNRQNKNGQKTILPILYKISVAQLKERYPEVADIQALDSADYSCDEIALKFACQLIKRLKT